MAAAPAYPILDTEHPDFNHEDERASIAASQASTADTFASSSQSQMPAPCDDTVASSQSSVGQEDGERGMMMQVDSSLEVARGNGMERLNGDGPVLSSPQGLAKLQTQGVGKPIHGNGTAATTITLNGDTPHGQKRTASGQVKTPTMASTISPNGVGFGHKRTTSTNTQVTELSAQLRARLSYAMLKVQNGWETRTLDEIEALASQQGSPMSLTSPWRAAHSPQQGFSPNALRPHESRGTTQASKALNGSLQTDPNFSSYAQQPPHSHIPGFPAPALAPPVDFGARANPRRTTVSGRPPPGLTNANGINTSNLSASSASSAASAPSASLIPATPPLHETPATTLQTPSQRATASERDAIETLLFMSSPGNSQNFRNSASQPLSLQAHLQHPPPRSAMSASPQRSRLPHSAKQVSFVPASNVAALAMDTVDRVPLSPRKKGLLDGARLETEESIDRVLDQMPVDGDGDSSSDESLGSVAPPPERPERPVAV